LPATAGQGHRDELATIPTVIGLSRRARKLVVQNLVIAAVFITGLVVWDLAGHLPLPLGVAEHEGSTVIVGLNGLRLLAEAAWRLENSVSCCELGFCCGISGCPGSPGGEPGQAISPEGGRPGGTVCR
jgi:hypothetical protein